MAEPLRGHPTSATPASETPVSTSVASGAYQQLWHAMLTACQSDVPLEEFTTWLAVTTLLDIDHQQQIAVVGTPHVFARDVVQQRYGAVLTAALAAHLLHAYALTLVVGSA